MYSLNQLSLRLLAGYLVALIAMAALLEFGILYPRQVDYVSRLQSIAIGAYRQLLEQKSDALLSITEDYANLNELHLHAELKQPHHYFSEHLALGSMKTLNVHGLLLTNAEHKVVFSRAQDPVNNQLIAFPELIPTRDFQPGAQQTDEPKSGWIYSGRGVFLVTVAPIKAHETNHIEGFLYFFRFQPDQKLTSLGDIQGLSVSIERFERAQENIAPLFAGEPDNFEISPRHYRYLDALGAHPSVLLTLEHRMQPVPARITLKHLLLFFGIALFPFFGMLLYRRVLIRPIVQAIKEVGRQDAQGLPVAMTYTPKTRDFEQLINSYNKLVQSVHEHQSKLHALASTDSLTGLLNRRSFDRSLLNAGQRSERLQQPLCLVILDVDNFKKYNDHYGHVAGDAVLRQLAELLRTHFCRATDRVGRFGGEEFIILMEAFPIEQVRPHLEELLQALQALKIEHIDSDCARYLSASVGAIHYTPGTDLRHNLTPDALVTEADQNLYQAKNAGRNRVVVSEWQAPPATEDSIIKKADKE